MHIVAILTAFLAGAVAFAGQSVAGELDISVLMGADRGAVTSFEGVNSKGIGGRPYTYRACHSPDGILVVQTQHRATGAKTYTNTGRWRIEGNAVCLEWDNPEGWNKACHVPREEGENVAMINVTDPTEPPTVGKFTEGIAFDFCKEQFMETR